VSTQVKRLKQPANRKWTSCNTTLCQSYNLIQNDSIWIRTLFLQNDKIWIKLWDWWCVVLGECNFLSKIADWFKLFTCVMKTRISKFVLIYIIQIFRWADWKQILCVRNQRQLVAHFLKLFKNITDFPTNFIRYYFVQLTLSWWVFLTCTTCF